jgi:RNA:NAD 2'-phosphotransferase (TPT1/KptA family)
MNDRVIRLSKYLAKYLRHAPAELGLTLRPGASTATRRRYRVARRAD